VEYFSGSRFVRMFSKTASITSRAGRRNFSGVEVDTFARINIVGAQRMSQREEGSLKKFLGNSLIF
jgi:hypothetical protein